MNKEVVEMIRRISTERNIGLDALFEAVEAAMVTASKRVLGQRANVCGARIDRESGDVTIIGTKSVVEDDQLEEPLKEMTLAEARAIDPSADYDDDFDVDLYLPDFDRIAAQAAKQLITQRIREAEREMIFAKYQGQEGRMVNGKVMRYSKGDVILQVDNNVEALLTFKEQAFGERYRFGDKVKAIIREVWDGKTLPVDGKSPKEARRSSKDPQIRLTRRDPNLVLLLFEEAVQEIRDGVVTIRMIAREPGKRSKIAVLSSDSSVDAVGACVGMKGSRVQMVVQELQGERIDIVEYSSDLRRFVANSLKPAEVESVEILEDETGSRRASVVVREDQHALAIGKGGLNANLASRLTGIEIDIVAATEMAKALEDAQSELMKIEGMNDTIATGLLMENIFTVHDLLDAGIEVLTRIEGVEDDEAEALMANAEKLAEEESAEEEVEYIEYEEGEEIPEGEEVEYIEVYEDVEEDEEPEGDVEYEEVEVVIEEEADPEETESQEETKAT